MRRLGLVSGFGQMRRQLFAGLAVGGAFRSTFRSFSRLFTSCCLAQQVFGSCVFGLSISGFLTCRVLVAVENNLSKQSLKVEASQARRANSAEGRAKARSPKSHSMPDTRHQLRSEKTEQTWDLQVNCWNVFRRGCSCMLAGRMSSRLTVTAPARIAVLTA